jgi:hypothetical protein
MLKDLLKKKFRQLWLAAETWSATETPSCWQVQEWRERMNGRADKRAKVTLENSPSFWLASRNVLTTARAASGM